MMTRWNDRHDVVAKNSEFDCLRKTSRWRGSVFKASIDDMGLPTAVPVR